jgi:uncharacterized repeat protein (TIGR03943 family)
MTSKERRNTNDNTASLPGTAIVLLEAATLAVLAGFLAWSHFAGRLVYFLAPAYLWLPPAAAVVVAVMAAVRLMGLFCRNTSCHCEGHQGSALSQLFCAAIILGAVAAGGAVRPAEFTNEGWRKREVPSAPRDPAVEKAIGWVLRPAVNESDGPTETTAVALPKDASVLDVVTLTQQSPPEALDGQFLSLLGQSAAGPTRERFDLYRLVVNCCIADATAVSIPVQLPPGTKLHAGWVRVDGTLKFDDASGMAAPFIQAAGVKSVAEPREPYLQPQ